MAKKNTEPTARPVERAFLVGVDTHNKNDFLSLEDSLAELALLADTAGLEVVGQATQRLDHPNPQTFIGPGKVEEVKALVENYLADVVVFDEELSPRHLRELERIFGEKVRILDRTALILDIFAQHAHTREGSLQVELAQYEYRLPRLTRAWTHLARQAGGGGGRSGGVGGVGLRGPGETQLEVDRREIRRRIENLKSELEKVRTHRQQYRARRRRSRIPVVALVGYTNAGKSTLLNRLTEAGVYVADQLFATLDPTTRRVELPGGHVALFTDTVGFIQKLPTQLVAAFRATLEEIADADLLLHLVDITHLNAQSQAEAVHQTLAEIEADHIPVVTVLNKIDRLHDPEKARQSLAHFPTSVAISALKGTGIADLLKTVGDQLYETYIPVVVRLPYQEGGLISLFHEQGQVENVEPEHGSQLISGKLPGRLVARFKPFAHLPEARENPPVGGLSRRPTSGSANMDDDLLDDEDLDLDADEDHDDLFEDVIEDDLYDDESGPEEPGVKPIEETDPFEELEDFLEDDLDVEELDEELLAEDLEDDLLDDEELDFDDEDIDDEGFDDD